MINLKMMTREIQSFVYDFVYDWRPFMHVRSHPCQVIVALSYLKKSRQHNFSHLYRYLYLYKASDFFLARVTFPSQI